MYIIPEIYLCKPSNFFAGETGLNKDFIKLKSIFTLYLVYLIFVKLQSCIFSCIYDLIYLSADIDYTRIYEQRIPRNKSYSRTLEPRW